jgi:heme/copper-type cytochrome/quinol oxidase subunit 2
MNSLILAATEGEHEIVNTLPFPSVIFGVIAMSVFILLAWVTWSYRDVANRHEHKVSDSKASH